MSAAIQPSELQKQVEFKPEPFVVISFDPATGLEVGRVPNCGAPEVAAAVQRARAAQSHWAALSYKARGRIIMRARELILAELDQIAELITKETGKPLAEAHSGELAPGLDLMQYFARNTGSLLRPERINIGMLGLMARSSRIEYIPLGVIAIISPWNYPWSLPLGEVVPALMAGNAVVLKPSELTPLTALKFADVLRRAGLPEGLLEVVTGDGATGAALAGCEVNKIAFTGSVATGKRVAVAAAERLIPVVLELGGKDAMIVLEDAHLESACDAAVWGAFTNSGQVCASVERCYVHEKIATEFIAGVIKRTKALRQGSGLDPITDVGAMSSERQLELVTAQVADAVKCGARIEVGGGRCANLPGMFFAPTVLTAVDHNMDVMREETFGPLLPIMTFATEAEAVRLANDSRFGLTASVFSRNIARAERVAAQLEAGTVMVNEVVYTHGIAQTPWGGFKQSGLGRTHGRLGLLELVAVRHRHVRRLPFLGDLWWYPYDAQAIELFRGFARSISSGSLLKVIPLLPQILRRFFARRR